MSIDAPARAIVRCQLCGLREVVAIEGPQGTATAMGWAVHFVRLHPYVLDPAHHITMEPAPGRAGDYGPRR